jgi:hypothetical protein
VLEYAQIKDVLINRLGLKDLAAYKRYLDSYLNSGSPKLITKEEIELLSPDNVNNYDFWKLAEEMFGVDPVYNTDFGEQAASLDEANRRNLAFARLTGALNVIDAWKHLSLSLLEIGAGYGNFKSYVMCTTNFQYTGVDVYPKAEGVLSTLPNGMLPDEVKAKKFNIVYSSNVFQHISSKQRLAYLLDIKNMLHDGGFFIFNLFLAISSPKVPSWDGRPYMQNYGQWVEIPLYQEFTRLLSSHYWVAFETRRHSDDLFTFVCRPRRKPAA